MIQFLLPTSYLPAMLCIAMQAGLLLTCAFAYLCWRRIDLAIALTVFALPAYLIRFSLWGIPCTLLEMMIVVMFVVWAARNHAKLYAKPRKADNIVATAEEFDADGGREAQVKSQKLKVQSLPEKLYEKLRNVKHSAASAEEFREAERRGDRPSGHLAPPPAGAERRTGRGQGVGALGVWLSEYKWLIGLLLIAATVSVFVSSDRLAALGIWKAYFVEPILFFIVLVNVFQNKTDCRSAEINSYQLPSTPINFHQLFIALGLSSLLVAIPAIVQKFTAWGITNPFWAAEETRRVVSWYGFPNAVGLYLGPMVVWLTGGLVYWWTGEKKEVFTDHGGDKGDKGDIRKKVVASLVLCFIASLSILAIVFAKSEGAIVGVAAGVVALVFGLAGGRARRRIGLIGLICLIGLIAYTPARQLIMEKATFSDLSGQIRVQQWKETWNMLKDGRLIFGAGLANYQAAIKPYHQEGIFFNFDKDPNFRNNLVFGNAEYKATHWQPTEIYLYPHNFFLNFWSETGLLGLLAMLGILIKFFTDYLRTDPSRRPLYLVLFSVMIAVAVHGMVDVQYFKNDLSVLFWLIIGCAALTRNGAKSKE